MVLPQVLQTKKWYPSKLVRQTRSFKTLVIILGLIRSVCLIKSFHQLPLSIKMSLSLIPLLVVYSITGINIAQVS